MSGPEARTTSGEPRPLQRWQGWAADFSVPFYPHVSVGWDTNPRFKELKEDLITGSTPELFGKYLRQAADFVDRQGLSPRLITVNSWNEWSEGSYLEPDMVHGMGYLNAVEKVLRESGSTA